MDVDFRNATDTPAAGKVINISDTLAKMPLFCISALIWTCECIHGLPVEHCDHPVSMSSECEIGSRWQYSLPKYKK